MTAQLHPGDARARHGRRQPRAGRAAVGLALAVALWGCAPIPPPDVLGELDSVRMAPASLQAKEHAPGAYAHAETLRAEAQSAFDDGDIAGAQILGERASAAFAAAAALARVARAEAVRVSAKADADAARVRLAQHEADTQRVTADIEALERRLRALRALAPLTPSDEARGGREEARMQAVVSLALEARMLCTAAELLARDPSRSGGGSSALPEPQRKEIDAARTAQQALDTLLAGGPAAAPIDEAVRARAACLAALTGIRRAMATPAAAPGQTDALLATLSSAGFAAQRDASGVSVALHDTFERDALSPAAAARLDQLGALASQHPRFPLMVVLHQGGPPRRAPSPPQSTARAALVAARLQAAGAPSVPATELAGAAQPVVPPGSKYSAKNERVVIVFVTPSLL